jgi:uncharacterized membrane protein HdeD (DUF308 family)
MQQVLDLIRSQEGFMVTSDLAEEIKRRSWLSIFVGILIALVGVFFVVYPLTTVHITTPLLGWLLIFVGSAQVVCAFNSQIGKFFLKFPLGSLYIISGFALAFIHIAGVPLLAKLLGTLLCVYAGLAVATAFRVRPVKGRGWLLFDGVVSFSMAMLIVARGLSESFWEIVTIVGAAVLVGGISRIMIAASANSATGSIGGTRPKAA